MRESRVFFVGILASFLVLGCATNGTLKRSKDLAPNHPRYYFGQQPPSLTAKLFAPGLISREGRFESAVSFSPDLDEIYFSAYSEGEETSIYFSKFVGNDWSPIKRANFTNGEKNGEMHPFVSHDGARIYFTAFDSSFADEKIWYVNRLKESWSDAIELESPVNDGLVFSPSQAKNGDLYYTKISGARNIETNYAPNRNGQYPEARKVDIDFGHHAFISPSRDYLLVTGRNREDQSRSDSDIYVYFRNFNGTWTTPINLGNTVNSNFDEISPRITPDGKFLFFGRSERNVEPSDVYWVSAEVIDLVRPGYLRNSDVFESETSLSRLQTHNQ